MRMTDFPETLIKKKKVRPVIIDKPKKNNNFRIRSDEMRKSRRDGLPQNRIESDLPNHIKHKKMPQSLVKNYVLLSSAQNWKIKNADSHPILD